MANREQLRDEDQPTGDVGPGRRRLSSRKVRALGGAGLVAVLGAGGYGIVALASTGSAVTTPSTSLAAVDASATGGMPPAGGFGETGHRTPPAAAGTVKSVDTTGDSFVVTSFKGAEVTVDVTHATTYRDRKVTSPTFGDITPGQRVMVRGTTTSGVVTATSVAIMPAGGPGDFGRFGGAGGSGGTGHRTPPAAAGTVKSVDTTGDSFVVTSFKGADVTVDVTPTTTYRDRKVTSPTFGDITPGERVMVRGTTTSGVVTATSVAIMPAGAPGTPGTLGGSGGFGRSGGASGWFGRGAGSPVPGSQGTSGGTVSGATVTS